MTITLREIYEKLIAVETKVNAIVSDVPDHEARIRSLERRQWPLPVLSAVLALGALAVTIVPQVVR